MRLTPEEITAIKSAAAEAFGASAVVRLFGSRRHDHLRGGDIDLLVEVDRLEDEDERKYRFKERFWQLTEPRKVDVLVATRGVPRGAFEQIAYRDGLVL